MKRFALTMTIAVAIAASGWLAYQGRRAFIQRFFEPGIGHARAPALHGSEDGTPWLPAKRLRVVLLDGVDRKTARTLPAYDAMCGRGVEVTIDVGFPTVSLPVQSALWTGLTQQQSGLQFIGRHMTVEDALPRRVPDSIAIAESHPFIVHSFGFAHTEPAMDVDKNALAEWKASGFADAAREAVAQDSALVFVHALGTDTAGHKHGRASSEFTAAAAKADALLEQLVAADAAVHGDSTRWLVLADHGHLAGGGHGGAEDAIRLVRGCIAGPGIAAPSRPGHLVHMIDVARLLSDSLGLDPAEGASGRPMHVALAASEQPGATLPTPSLLRFVLAGLLLLVAGWVTFKAAAGSAWQWPWWMVIGFLCLLIIDGWPTLSTPMTYRPRGHSVTMAALPGLIWLALACGASLRRSYRRVAVCQLAIPAALVGATLMLCWGQPPLVPTWTALASITLILWFSGAAVVALAGLVAVCLYAFDRGTPEETSRRGP